MSHCHRFVISVGNISPFSSSPSSPSSGDGNGCTMKVWQLLHSHQKQNSAADASDVNQNEEIIVENMTETRLTGLFRHQMHDFFHENAHFYLFLGVIGHVSKYQKL
jgi:hypothetical protein